MGNGVWVKIVSIAILQDQVPEQLKFAEQRRLLSRVALSISLILTIYLCIVSIIMPVLTVGKLIAALAAILIGSLAWLCHYERLYTASAATIVAITIIGGFVASLSNGGADGFVAPIMISAPVTAAVFIGARATLVSAIGVVLAIVSLLYLERIGLVTEAPYTPQVLDIAAIVMLSASTGICASGVGYFAHAMQTQIRSLRDSQNRLVQASEQLDHAAHHDSLTGVANRQGLQRYLDVLMAEGTRSDSLICLAHVDLDEFKSINDTYGHPVGDAVLQQAAKIMCDEFFEGSMVARVGGDEFVIVALLPSNVDPTDIQSKCEQLICRLKTPMIANGVECKVGASIGFVTSDGSDHAIESLMTDADLALYDVKRDGRGQARPFAPIMRAQLEEKRLFKNEIDAALANARVACVLQPQVCMETGKVIGLEGLGRIRCKSGNLLAPAQILPVLTEMGRLPEFDIKVMQCSLDALISLRAEGHDLPNVSINASSESLRDPDYVTRVCDELRNRDLTAQEVVVEVLESTLIESADDAAIISINKLRAAGIKTLMDDFGSGHATISNLLKLELDGLKIDRSLIARIESEKTFKVVRAIHSLAIELGLTVVVEGVETSKQFGILRSLGCQSVQGFGICKPKEPDALSAWLRDYGASQIHHLQDRVSTFR